MKTGHFLLRRTKPFRILLPLPNKRELLEVQEKEKISEKLVQVRGYQTAVLVTINAFVYTVERQKDLHDFAQKKLREMHGFFVRNFKVLVDGFLGLPTFVPFDKILVKTCGAANSSD